jgi:hypothetical protein
VTSLAAFVQKTTGLPAAIAEELTAAGGVLRCDTCHAEEPLGDVAAHLTSSWPEHCGEAMIWITSKALLAEQSSIEMTGDGPFGADCG